MHVTADQRVKPVTTSCVDQVRSGQAGAEGILARLLACVAQYGPVRVRCDPRGLRTARSHRWGSPVTGRRRRGGVPLRATSRSVISASAAAMPRSRLAARSCSPGSLPATRMPSRLRPASSKSCREVRSAQTHGRRLFLDESWSVSPAMKRWSQTSFATACRVCPVRCVSVLRDPLARSPQHSKRAPVLARSVIVVDREGFAAPPPSDGAPAFTLRSVKISALVLGEFPATVRDGQVGRRLERSPAPGDFGNLLAQVGVFVAQIRFELRNLLA